VPMDIRMQSLPILMPWQRKAFFTAMRSPLPQSVLLHAPA
jgi:hypothetical protein